MSVVGTPIKHDSAIGHVTGSAQYVDDIEPSVGQLHVAIGQASIAHGRIVSMDLSDVHSSEGVVDVLTFSDLPHATDIGPVFKGDPLLVDKTVEFMGQPVFVVAASSHRLARQAVLKAKISYEELSPQLDIAESIEQSFFVRPPHRMQRGDSARELEQSLHRIQGELHIGGQEHFYLEGQVAKALSLIHI